MANRTITTHFSDKELDCHCGCGKTVSPELLVPLEALRQMIGRPLVLTSGARCEEHNRKIGGQAGSWHLKGLAVDIACDDGAFRGSIIHLAGSLGFNGIGVAKGFIHLDLRPAEQRRCFLYS